MSEHKDRVYTAPGHNATERAEMEARLRKTLIKALIPVVIATIIAVVGYVFVVPQMNATGQHYYYHGVDDGPVGTYFGNLMLAVVPLLWLMVYLSYSMASMRLPPKIDYGSPNLGLGDTTHDEEWYQAVTKTEKLIADDFYTILMRVPRGPHWWSRSPSEKVYGGYDLEFSIGTHTYLLRRLRWDELTDEQKQKIKEQEAKDRRNNRLAVAGGFGAGVIIGSGGSVH